jgi:sarcosine oxidase subunit beta
VGEVVRDLYLDREPFMDVAPFSADRFADNGALLSEVHII